MAVLDVSGCVALSKLAMPTLIPALAYEAMGGVVSAVGVLTVDQARQTVQLATSPPSPAHVGLICDLVARNSAWTELDLHGQPLGNTGGAWFADCLAANPRLHAVSVSYDLVGEAGCDALAAMCDAHPTLARIDFRFFPRELRRAEASLALNLSASAVTFVPRYTICDMAELRELSLRCALVSLPRDIGALTLLRTLRLEHNQIARLPASLGACVGLEELRLNHNKLRDLPASIGALTSLRELYLHNNELLAVPAEIGDLAALEILYLSSNKLALVPESFSRLSALRNLDLYNNQLEALPFEVTALPALEYLDVENNNLKVKLLLGESV